MSEYQKEKGVEPGFRLPSKDVICTFSGRANHLGEVKSHGVYHNRFQPFLVRCIINNICHSQIVDALLTAGRADKVGACLARMTIV